MLETTLDGVSEVIPLKRTSCGDITFAFHLTGSVGKKYFDRAKPNSSERNLPAFSRDFGYDPVTGITGASFFDALRLDMKLGYDDFWIPTPKEAVSLLGKSGSIFHDSYSDFGLVVHSTNTGCANESMAQDLASSTRRHLPLVIPFKSLDYEVDSSFHLGVSLSLVDNTSDVLSASKAERFLSGFNEGLNSGARIVYRSSSGRWFSDNPFLGGRGSNGCVPFAVGVASEEDLRVLHESIVNEKYTPEIARLKRQVEELRNAGEGEIGSFKKALASL